MEVFVRPCIYEVFCEDVGRWTFIDNDFFFFVFLELYVQIRLCKSWFNVGAATMFHT